MLTCGPYLGRRSHVAGGEARPVPDEHQQKGFQYHGQRLGQSPRYEPAAFYDAPYELDTSTRVAAEVECQKHLSLMIGPDASCLFVVIYTKAMTRIHVNEGGRGGQHMRDPTFNTGVETINRLARMLKMSRRGRRLPS